MEKSMRLPINMRRWMIDRFIQQKESENAAMEAARKKSQSRKK
jgi:hypothetical protein